LEAKTRRASDDHALAVAAKQCEMEAALNKWKNILPIWALSSNDVQSHNAAVERKFGSLHRTVWAYLTFCSGRENDKII
jgi:hypothetical protein